jgi:hypothetical protein
MDASETMYNVMPICRGRKMGQLGQNRDNPQGDQAWQD